MKVSEVAVLKDLSVEEVVFLVLRLQEMLMRAENVKQQMGVEPRRFTYQELTDEIARQLPESTGLLRFAREKGVL